MIPLAQIEMNYLELEIKDIINKFKTNKSAKIRYEELKHLDDGIQIVLDFYN